MHIKNIHCMIEKLAEYCKRDIEKGYESLDVGVVGGAVDMLKDLCEAEYHARLAKCLEKEEEENKEEEKYFLKMLKEEYGMEDEEEAKRFYRGQPRSRTSGRFMSRGDGRRSGRRGYEEMPYYHMTPEMMKEHTPEYWRDMDREQGRIYFSSPMNTSNAGSRTGFSDSSNSQNVSGENIRAYSNGFNDGSKRGYEDGYSDASMNAKKFESRYDKVRRNYTETKSMHKGNTQEDNAENMKGLEKLLNVIDEDIKEFMPNMTPSEKTMLKQKFTSWAQKTQ